MAKPRSWSKSCRTTSAASFKEFQSAYEAVGTDLFDQQEGSLRKLTPNRHAICVVKLDGWIRRTRDLLPPSGVIARWQACADWRAGRDWPDSVAGGDGHQRDYRRCRFLGTTLAAMGSIHCLCTRGAYGRLWLLALPSSPVRCLSANTGSQSAHSFQAWWRGLKRPLRRWRNLLTAHACV